MFVDYASTAILTPKNVDADKINDIAISLLQGESYELLSVDSILQEDTDIEIQHFPVEYLNTINPTGMPPHKLILKIGAPIIYEIWISK